MSPIFARTKAIKPFAGVNLFISKLIISIQGVYMSILCPVTLEWTSSNTATLHRTNRLENGWMSGYIINKPPDSYVINYHKH